MTNVLSIRENSSNTTKLKDSTLDSYLRVFLGSQKESTSKAYKTAIELFANFFFKKEMKFVTKEEIESIKSIDVSEYIQWLYEPVEKNGNIEPRYKNATAKKHINGIKSFYRFLSSDFSSINPRIFEAVKLKSPELTAQSWDGLDWTEAIMIWEYAQENLGEDSNKISMLFKLASVTSIRLSALLSLEWNKHWFVKKENGIDINYIQIIDKDKIHKKPVSESFYNELKDKLPEEKLFVGLNQHKVGKILKHCLDALGFDERRNIKFHSFKKAGVMRALESSGGNMYKAKEQGNHSSIATAEKYYLKYKESLMNMTSFSMEEDVDTDIFATLSKEELIEAIMKMNEGSKRELYNIVKNS